MTQEEKLVHAKNIALSRTNGQYQKWYQEHGLNSYLIQTLYALYMEPSMSQKEISENYQMPCRLSTIRLNHWNAGVMWSLSRTSTTDGDAGSALQRKAGSMRSWCWIRS